MVAKNVTVTAVESKGTALKDPMHPSPIAKVPVSSGARHAWLKDFWDIWGQIASVRARGAGGTAAAATPRSYVPSLNKSARARAHRPFRLLPFSEVKQTKR